VFALYGNNVGAGSLYDPSGGGYGAGARKFGTTVVFFSTAAGVVDTLGTWAVTAAAGTSAVDVKRSATRASAG
jgi:hypothetical protein